ncbi:hypothetical protein EB796_009292 [Bugula neritina]|uniref:Uncharacterized protein n=1 Tax=Bugula neritina TaxID=10212 RepID=A0A7J7K489_BUGNE|nr:hypothetical protein EB796_009292 [Bugula neritina]
MVTSAGFVNGTITQLSDSVETLKNASATALDAISQVESSIKNNASNIVRQVLSSYAKTLSDDITDDANAGLDENGLWFSLGWSLIMLIPCMICGLVLANLYRRRSPYDGDYKDDL